MSNDDEPIFVLATVGSELMTWITGECLQVSQGFEGQVSDTESRYFGSEKEQDHEQHNGSVGRVSGTRFNPPHTTPSL